MEKVKCPACDASYFTVKYATTTAAYYPPIYKDGVNVNPDGNETTTTCTCLNCGHNFAYRERYGKVEEISDLGEEPRATTIEIPINSEYKD
jgi:hypothetical protein